MDTASPAALGANPRGWLRNGNTPGDPNSAPRCGARTRGGGSCRSPAMKNGRCRMHGGASTGPTTRIGRALCGQVNRKHPVWLAETRDDPTEAHRAARLLRAANKFAHAWANPWRRPKALLGLLRAVGRLLPDPVDPSGDVAIGRMVDYVRGAVDDVLRWLGKPLLAARERSDSERVLAILTDVIDACSIGASLYRAHRRRHLRTEAQRRRRAAVKPASAANDKPLHAPRASSEERGRPARIMRGHQAAAEPRPHARAPYCGRSADILSASSRAAGTALSRLEAGGPTRMKPTLSVGMEAPHTPRESSRERGRPTSIMSGHQVAAQPRPHARAPVKPSLIASRHPPHAPRAGWRFARPPPVRASLRCAGAVRA